VLLQPAVLGQPWQAQLDGAASCVGVPQHSAFASGSQQLDRVLDGSIRFAAGLRARMIAAAAGSWMR
jgi:hypothetical protein